METTSPCNWMMGENKEVIPFQYNVFVAGNYVALYRVENFFTWKKDQMVLRGKVSFNGKQHCWIAECNPEMFQGWMISFSKCGNLEKPSELETENITIFVSSFVKKFGTVVHFD